MQEHIVGGLILVYTPSTSVPDSPEQLIEQAKGVLREWRVPKLNSVVGILSVATVAGDVRVQLKAVDIRQALLDITSYPDLLQATTQEEIDLAVQAAQESIIQQIDNDPAFSELFE